MYITTAGIGRRLPGDRGQSPRRSVPAIEFCSPDPSATTASRSCWRAASSTSRPISAPTRARCCRWSRRSSAAAGAGPPLDARPDPRRRRHRAQRARAATAASASTSTRSRSPCATGCAAPASCSASIRCTSPTKVSSSPSWRRSAPTRRSPRCAPRLAAARPRSSARSASSRPRRCSSTTRYGGSRIVDMLVGDPLPRIC